MIPLRPRKPSQSDDGNIDIDDAFITAATASIPQGITTSQLSKVWRIDIPTAEKTLELTTQRIAQPSNERLRHNYGTSDHMLRYKRIHTYFFMDTFFATSKGGKSSRNHTCCQLFVTDKGFVHVVPMRSKKEVYQAVKQFAKEIGAPDALISDGAAEQ